jgi:hypothetical protein
MAVSPDLASPGWRVAPWQAPAQYQPTAPRPAPRGRHPAMALGAHLLPLLAQAEDAGLGPGAVAAIAAASGLTRTSVAKRLLDLSRMRPAFVCSRQTRRVVTWRLTDLGRCYVETLLAGLGGSETGL